VTETTKCLNIHRTPHEGQVKARREGGGAPSVLQRLHLRVDRKCPPLEVTQERIDGASQKAEQLGICSKLLHDSIQQFVCRSVNS
jgi:hypothetical protein